MVEVQIKIYGTTSSHRGIRKMFPNKLSGWLSCAVDNLLQRLRHLDI